MPQRTGSNYACTSCTPAQAGVQRTNKSWAPAFTGERSTQFRPEPLVHQLRVGLARHRLHRLADEKAEQLLLAGLVLGDLVGIGGEDLVDLRIDLAGVAGLLESALDRKSVV